VLGPCTRHRNACNEHRAKEHAHHFSLLTQSHMNSADDIFFSFLANSQSPCHCPWTISCVSRSWLKRLPSSAKTAPLALL
jgi:hypothetical protein